MNDATLGKAYIQIVPSADGIKGSIEKSLNGEAGSAGKSAGSKIAAAAKKVLIAAGIGQAFVTSIKAGGALEQSIGGVQTLYKNNADQIIKYADNAYKTAGMSADDYMETATGFAASLLQSLGGNTQKASKYTQMAITDMSDNANKMGTDMEMIKYAYQGFAKQNYTMLDNLKLGYGGTKEEMERLLADAEKISGQEYDISNLSDVYDAIHVIQGELGITGTTAKEAATTLLGSFNSMKSAATNFIANLTLGRNIGPSMAALAESASVFLFNNLIPAIGRIFASLPAAIVSFVKAGIPQIKNLGGQLIENFVTGIKEKTSSTVPEEAIGTITSFINGVLKKIPEVAAAFGKIMQNVVRTIASNLPKIMSYGGQLIGKLVAGIIKNLPHITVAIWKVILKIQFELIKSIPKIIAAGAKLIGGLAQGLGGAALKKIRNVMTSVKNAITSPISKARDAIRREINRIKSLFNITLKFKGIKLPHISVSWNKGGDLAIIAEKLGLPGVPDFGVRWYKTGGIFNDPAIIGLGEAGSEAVVPLDSLWQRFDLMADSIVNGVNSIIRGNNVSHGGEIVIPIYLFPNGTKMGEWVVNTYDTYKRRLG